METLKLEQWPLARLRPYERGLRKYGKDVVERMMAAIREYGFRVPVLARCDGEVVDGRLRLDAAARLGLATVPVIPADGLTEAQVRAFRLLVNRSATWAAWDEDMVAVELGELRELDVDLALTGFDVAELDELLGLLPLSGRTDPDDVPPVPETPLTRPGDVWLLGRHRLLCGDATSSTDLAALLGEERPELAVTDPPYNVAVEGKAGKILNDNMGETAFREFLGRAFAALFEVLADGAAVYVAHSETEGLTFRESFLAAGFKLAGCLIWRKNVHVLGRSDYHWQHEPILYGWKPTGRHAWFGGRRQTTLLEALPGAVLLDDGRVQIPAGDNVYLVSGQDLSVEIAPGSIISVDKPPRSDAHPTMKPVALLERFIRNSSRPGDLVIDPFGGSGSTFMACEGLGRSCRTLELDPRFCDVIVRRWQDHTGHVATRPDGRPFPVGEGAA
ncbi:DNA methylase N-4/N-6 domain protein [Solidesulfovibrio fructosivorans JJ]]|uniref:site-specific DNA-methyltransferase (adenine-specific) n=1 Tax=Solidesulfovibrio fructosivorans JJ] TaxID=596151 RepID=E1JR29_SOLFR|nr:site-specific DNA-methyltransferase [Solidesulfovibrio fructosivorans]EFL53030.1 DNA methylase N-4/N-6 domain protein [Solidesulfovibrio fructosivorans JJ]]